VTLKDLSQLYYLNREIERDKAELDALYSRVLRAGSLVMRQKGYSGFSDKVARYAMEIADLKETIDANIQRCFYERTRLIRYINDIPDSLTRGIFTLRFEYGLSWDQVAAGIGGGNTAESVRKRVFRHLKNN